MFKQSHSKFTSLKRK